jgi:ATP-dependent Clp protease ATP-binding subunit ClpA
MSFYGSFSARARRTIFLAHSQASAENTQEITPEHILSALLKEDPNLFALLLPNQPNVANEIEHLLAATRKTNTIENFSSDKVVLSAESKEVVFAASEGKKRLGHKSVGTQHLLLALLVTEWKRPRLLRARVRQNDSAAKRILEKYGLSAASVEEKTREGIVTPQTWVLDDSLIKLNAQLTAIAELLIAKRIFTRTEFVAILDQNADPFKPETFLAPLMEALREKGSFTAAEKETVKSLASVASSQRQLVDEPTVDDGSSIEPRKPPISRITGDVK